MLLLLCCVGCALFYSVFSYFIRNYYFNYNRNGARSFVVRIASLSLIGLVSFLFLCLAIQIKFKMVNFDLILSSYHDSTSFLDIFTPLFIFLILYVGYSIVYFLENGTFGRYFELTSNFVNFSRIVIDPFFEEFTYRFCIIKICIINDSNRLEYSLISAILFALSHLNKKVSFKVLLVSVFITFVFGFVGALFYCSTFSLLSLSIAHTFCNYMGAPSLSLIHKKKIYKWIFYPLSIAAFFIDIFLVQHFFQNNKFIN
eukprot:TRINITY_DN1142_c0_g1_i1.p1 TRINITY_DN1142_c0_g1~~TRINITY_DN1142_c0_g1_i1.p1  ORF type:complete len:257 (-),score=24.10 TRINITY_DN1142_c0_g1_i1:3-773(-)